MSRFPRHAIHGPFVHDRKGEILKDIEAGECECPMCLERRKLGQPEEGIPSPMLWARRTPRGNPGGVTEADGLFVNRAPMLTLGRL